MYLCWGEIRLAEFGRFAQHLSERVKRASLAEATHLKRPVIYLPSSRADNDATARAIAERDKSTDGLICVLSSVEPCRSVDVAFQRLMHGQLRLDWPKHLDRIARQLNPEHEKVLPVSEPGWLRYYWTAFQSEWGDRRHVSGPENLGPVSTFVWSRTCAERYSTNLAIPATNAALVV